MQGESRASLMTSVHTPPGQPSAGGAEEPRSSHIEDDAGNRRQIPTTGHEHGGALISDGHMAPSFDELLFDLLFAASLNTYSQVATIFTASSFRGFVGFFALLWWAWWTQSVFDTRYRRPELLYPRWFKGFLLIVRLALLGTWTAFSATPSEFERHSFTNFSAVYACTRILLMVDWLSIAAYELFEGWLSSLRGQHTQAFSTKLLSLWPELLSAAVALISAALWWCERYIPDRHDVGSQVLALWLSGIAVELLAQIVVEVSCRRQTLSTTILPERLSLLGLIILGEGFNGVGEQLNKLSPGYKVVDTQGVQTEAGGWSGFTILQICSTVALIVLLFWGYFRRATKHFPAPRLLALVWAYLHIVIHAASAVVVVGMKRIISLGNTYEALARFLENPQRYLPQDGEWSSYNATIIDQYYEQNVSPPSAFELVRTDYRLGIIVAMINVIQATDGAQIPTVNQTQALLKSASEFILFSNSGASQETVAEELGNSTDASVAVEYAQEQYGAGLSSQLENFVQLSSSLVNSLSIQNYFTAQFFIFNYVFGACAVFLAADVCVKTIQVSGEQSRSGKPGRKRWRDGQVISSLTLRLVFAIILAIIQGVIYLRAKTDLPDAIILGGLTILACILVVELILQVLIDSRGPIYRLAVRLFRRRSKGRPTAAQPKGSSGDSSEAFEMEKASKENSLPESPAHGDAGQRSGLMQDDNKHLEAIEQKNSTSLADVESVPRPSEPFSQDNGTSPRLSSK